MPKGAVWPNSVSVMWWDVGKKVMPQGYKMQKNKVLIFDLETIGIVTVKIFLEMRLSEIILILGQKVL